MSDSITKALKVLAVAVLCVTVHVETARAATHGSKIGHDLASAWAGEYGSLEPPMRHAQVCDVSETSESTELSHGEETSDSPDEFSSGERAARPVRDYYARESGKIARRLISLVCSIGPARAPPRL